MPKEGNVVVYSQSDIPRLGIFRESRPNWNSPCGGTVESVWNRCTYQHDIFFVPSLYGNVAAFYRLKKTIKLEDLSIKPHDPTHKICPSFPRYYLKDDSFTFQPSPLNIERRKLVARYSGHTLACRIPEIDYLAHTRFGMVCYAYAFSHLLDVHSTAVGIPLPTLELMGETVLDKYFSTTVFPKQGDLVVYFDSTKITHWGVYLAAGRIESKWGQAGVYRHHFFDAPSILIQAEYANFDGVKASGLSDQKRPHI